MQLAVTSRARYYKKSLVSVSVPLPEAAGSSSPDPFRKWSPAPTERPASGSAPRTASARTPAGPPGLTTWRSGQAGKEMRNLFRGN